MKAGYLSWLGLLGAGIVAGIYTAARLFSEGHVLFNANDVVLWTLPIGSYVFFALISSGLGLLSALPLLFGVGRYMIEAKRIVLLAIATLLAAFVSIGLELGSLEHVHYLFLSPNMSSPIQIMGLIYSAELVFLVLKFWRIHKDDLDSGLSKVCGVGSFVCALFGPLVLGSIFGITEARPTFFGSFLPVLCLLIAIVSGLAGFVLYDSIYLLLVKTASSRAGEGTILDDASLKLCFTLFQPLGQVELPGRGGGPAHDLAFLLKVDRTIGRGQEAERPDKKPGVIQGQLLTRAFRLQKTGHRFGRVQKIRFQPSNRPGQFIDSLTQLGPGWEVGVG